MHPKRYIGAKNSGVSSLKSEVRLTPCKLHSMRGDKHSDLFIWEFSSPPYFTQKTGDLFGVDFYLY